MKILFFSDIHGIYDNIVKLSKVIDNGNFDKIVVLGDLYYCGPTYIEKMEVSPIKVKDFLMNYQDKLIILRGNCDSDVDVLSTDVPVCEDLVLINTDGIDIYCTHGNKYNIYKNSKLDRKGVLVYGHEHYPYIQKKYDMLYINSGSISLPRNDSKASYLVYENKTFTIYSIDGDIIDEVAINI